jgi:hypothetical protein
MCGRYVSPDEASIEREFNLVHSEWQFPSSFNVAPHAVGAGYPQHRGQAAWVVHALGTHPVLCPRRAAQVQHDQCPR